MKSSLRFLIVLPIFFLAACSNPNPGPLPDATVTPLEPPSTQIASATPATQGTHATTQALAEVPIVYYYFIAMKSNTYPAGSVEILPGELVLGPTLSKNPRTHDPVTDISLALTAMLNDPRNAWDSKQVKVTNIKLNDGSANVDLQGDYFAAGDIVLIAARYQILFSVFAEETVQTAVITLNGENIGNLGISRTSQALPSDYAYTRDEIMAFMAENPYPPQ